MARNARYRLPYRRRREQKTDYQARRIIATSKQPRFVVRVSNTGIIAQVVKAEIKGDRILTQASSNELSAKYNWKGGGKSIPSGYLLGFIAGYKAIKADVQTAYLDLGLKRPTKGSKVFAVVKGAIDAGLEVPCDSDVIPPPEKLNGGGIARYAELIDPEGYERQFSVYLRRSLRPETLPSHFDETKAKIREDWEK